MNTTVTISSQPAGASAPSFVPASEAFRAGVSVLAVPDREPSAPVAMPLVVSKDERYFWTRSWQESEARVDADLASGNYVEFDNMRDAIRYFIDNAQQ